MPLRTRLMHSGAAAELTVHICGGVSTVAAAGNSLATGTVLPNARNLVSSGSGGVTLQPMSPGESQFVANTSGSGITVYPPDSAGTINAGTAGAGVTLANNKCAEFVCMTAPDVIVYNISA